MVFTLIGALFVWGHLVSRLIFQEKTDVVWGSQMFQGFAPADGESDSALAELLSGSTLADQSSRGMLFVRLHLLVLLACEASTAANSIEGVSGGLVRVRRVSVLTLYPDLWSRASLAEAASRIPLPPASARHLR